MSSFSKGRSYFASQNSANNNDDQDKYYESGQTSRQMKMPTTSTRSNYTDPSNEYDSDGNEDDDVDDDNRYTRDGDDYYNDYDDGGNPYNGGVAVGTPYYAHAAAGGYSPRYNNGGDVGYSKSAPYNNDSGYDNSSPYDDDGGYGTNSTYSNGAGGEGGYASYNLPPSYWPVDGAKSPVVFHTTEVNVYTAPRGSSQYDNDSYNDAQRRGGGGGRGFFGPALHAVGHFFDRKFGLHDRE